MERDVPGADVVVETFTSPLRALERAEEEDFSLIISDYRMPEMDGVEFLSRVIELQPGVARMILSGYADRDAIGVAINETRILRFFGKPWDDAKLRRTVADLLCHHREHLEATAREDRLLGRERMRRRLEREAPGLMRVDFDDDGAIPLDDMPR